MVYNYAYIVPKQAKLRSVFMHSVGRLYVIVAYTGLELGVLVHDDIACE